MRREKPYRSHADAETVARAKESARGEQVPPTPCLFPLECPCRTNPHLTPSAPCCPLVLLLQPRRADDDHTGGRHRPLSATSPAASKYKL